MRTFSSAKTTRPAAYALAGRPARATPTGTVAASRVLSQLLLLAGLLTAQPLLAQQALPAKQWDQTFGGNADDYLMALQPTADGGCLLGGYSNSGISGTRTQNCQGDNDYWIVKHDAAGAVQWDRRFGGSGLDELFVMRQTADGGYLLGGHSRSGISGDNTQNISGDGTWVVKVNAAGTKLWDWSGGWGHVRGLAETVDGGYLIASTALGGGFGSNDYLVHKTSSTGISEWYATYGGPENEMLQAAVQTPDGGFLLAGYSRSGVGRDKTQSSQGGNDYWLVKINQLGQKEWDRTYGGPGEDYLMALLPTPDGGYLLGGTSDSGLGGNKSQGSRGGKDYWVVKVNTQGAQLWDRRFGGAQDETLAALQNGPNGSLLLSGSSFSGISGDKSQSSWGYNDYWLLQLDPQGTLLAERRYGGDGIDEARALVSMPDGGCLLGGHSTSGNFAGDKSQDNFGGVVDYWVVKLAPFGPLATREPAWAAGLVVAPVPVHDVLHVTLPALPAGARPEIRLHDVLGRAVALPHSVAEGSVTFTLPVGTLPAGVYFLRIALSGQPPLTRRVIIR